MPSLRSSTGAKVRQLDLRIADDVNAALCSSCQTGASGLLTPHVRSRFGQKPRGLTQPELALRSEIVGSCPPS